MRASRPDRPTKSSLHPARALLGGYLLDLAFGDPRRFHPVAGFGRLAALAERPLYRPSRLAGALHWAALCGLACGFGRLLERAAGRWRTPLGAVLLFYTLGGRSLDRAAARAQGLLAAGDLDGVRRALPALVGRELEGLGASQLAGAAIESLADNTVDAVVGAALWWALLGPTGTCLFRAANTLDAMVGHHSPRYERFGWAAARIDDWLVAPAAALAVALCAACAPAVGGHGGAALACAVGDGRRHPSPGSGPIQAAFAGALGVRLGGERRYGSRVESIPQLGRGRPPRTEDLGRARRLSRLVGGCAVVLCAALGRGVQR